MKISLGDIIIMGIYYEEIMGNKQTSFLSMFNDKWSEELSDHNMPYSHAEQIIMGNRLRPIILAWGYYSNTSNIEHEQILDFAICIELIHKASILLDDLIDNDNARHCLKTFHVEYSKTETILYAIFLINRSVTIMYEKDLTNSSLHTSTLFKIINNMCKGGIKEVTSNGFFTVQDVIEIIDLETTSLIENSFLLGYQLSNKLINKMPNEIFNIGHLCGHCFQILNDLEPFLAPETNKSYKGSINYDFERNRKNIIMSYLYGSCTKKERSNLMDANDFKYVYSLICKYKITDLILEDLKSKVNSIINSMSLLEKTNPLYYSDFAKFLNYMFCTCFEKCGLVFANNFLDKR